MEQTTLNKIENIVQKEKLLIMSNFNFFRNVSQRRLLKSCQKEAVCEKKGKWQPSKVPFQTINPFPHTTILQQTTLNIFCQKIENLYN